MAELGRSYLISLGDLLGCNTGISPNVAPRNLFVLDDLAFALTVSRSSGGAAAVITMHERNATLRTTNMQKRQIVDRMSRASVAKRECLFGVISGSAGASRLCLLCPCKRTSRITEAMSEKGQFQTHAPEQENPYSISSWASNCIEFR
jgi:hypothetical protein